MSDQILHAGRITRVRVFIDRAVVTRRLVLDGFCETVAIGPISAKVDAGSFRAKALLRRSDGSSEALRVAHVGAEMAHREVSDDQRESVRRALESIGLELIALNDSAGHEDRLRALLARYSQIVTDTLSWQWLDGDPSFDKWIMTFDLLREANERHALRKADEQDKLRKLQEQKAVLLLDERRVGQPERLGHRVELNFEPPSDSAGSLEIELSYETSEAQWMPAYDLSYTRAHEHSSARARLEAVAIVRQRTGEDWEGVELVATTARPPLHEPPPELRTLELRGRRREQAALITKERARRGGLLGGPGAGGPIGEGVEHRAPGSVSVPSSGDPVRIELFAGALTGSDRLELTPLMNPLPLRVAELGNDTGRVLLPGKINLFLDGAYAGCTELGFVLPGERFLVPLSREASLFAKREKRQLPDEERRFTGNKVRAYEIRTRIENLTSEAVRVWLRDRVPVAGTEEVKVTHEHPAGISDPDTGLSVLELQLAPREVKEIDGSFAITAAAGFMVPAAKA